VQPDAAGSRPSEGLGKETETLSKLRPVAATEQKAHGKISEDKWKCYELNEPVEEESARDLENSLLAFEYNVGVGSILDQRYRPWRGESV
jgi:hypothetical protein